MKGGGKLGASVSVLGCIKNMTNKISSTDKSKPYRCCKACGPKSGILRTTEILLEHLLLVHGIHLPPDKYPPSAKVAIATGEWTVETARFPDPVYFYDAGYMADPV